jgi:hypothetical protein
MSVPGPRFHGNRFAAASHSVAPALAESSVPPARDVFASVVGTSEDAPVTTSLPYTPAAVAVTAPARVLMPANVSTGAVPVP